MEVLDTGELMPDCAERLQANSALLQYSLWNSNFEKYDQGSEEMLFTTLSSIPTFTKTWFIVETYMMVSAGEEINRRAIQIALLFYDKVGISEEMYLKIIKQAYIETGDYREGMFNN